MFFVFVYVVFSHKPLPPSQAVSRMATKVTDFLKQAPPCEPSVTPTLVKC